jgi:mono/diheme cytochrome c family protein
MSRISFLLSAGALLTCSAAFAQEKQAAPNKDSEIKFTFSLNGKEMFETWCATCHGVEGKGNGPAASLLKKAPADLSQLAKKNGGKFPVERVRSYIDGTSNADAHGSREMPVWGSIFRRVDAAPQAITYRVYTLASYVESLQAK